MLVLIVFVVLTLLNTCIHHRVVSETEGASWFCDGMTAEE
jgi:hypothetical protein